MKHNDLDILAVQLDKGAYKPTRGHMDDAGFDLYSPVDAVVKAHDSVIINTGVHVKIPAGCAGADCCQKRFKHQTRPDGNRID